ncbi:hypothetical protein [Streptomyces chrestomyceticus]|uniref:hypothetical protein n=1 Tax=Streptomyces chrestomyceticus TaxID=68185 RepID=UPI0034013191
MARTSHSDKVASYEERRPDAPDELDERGRSAAAASTAGAVSSSMVVTADRLLCCLRADGTYVRGTATDGVVVGVGSGDVGSPAGGAGGAADSPGTERDGAGVCPGTEGAGDRRCGCDGVGEGVGLLDGGRDCVGVGEGDEVCVGVGDGVGVGVGGLVGVGVGVGVGQDQNKSQRQPGGIGQPVGSSQTHSQPGGAGRPGCARTDPSVSVQVFAHASMGRTGAARAPAGVDSTASATNSGKRSTAGWRLRKRCDPFTP